MKKLIFVLCAVFALAAVTAFAESAPEKVVLWEHTAKEMDADGNEIEQLVQVTLETKAPVEINPIGTVDVSDGFFAKISREGVAPVVVAISPADYGAHANLNNATEEQLQMLINRIAEQFEEGSYNSGVTKTESGNVYVYAGDSTTRSILQVYEDTLLELIQFHDDFSDLTAEDQAFAVEVLQGIWME